MATAVATATRPALPKDAVLVPPGLVSLWGAEKVRMYLARLEADTRFLIQMGGGQLQSAVDVHGDGSGIADMFTAPRRKVGKG